MAGYENKFLANTSRVYTLVKKKLKENPGALDTLCFGRLALNAITLTFFILTYKGHILNTHNLNCLHFDIQSVMF